MELSSGKKIAKNTIFLYLRTLILMFVTLYTSRVILSALGIQDYGTYTAIAGVVTMLSMVTGPLGAAISRFITYELGEGRSDRLNSVYSTSIFIMIIISLLAILLYEVVAVWFLNNKMVIPEGRMYAANWVLQFAILSFLLHLIVVPFNAAIIAYEKMSAFAYIGISDAILKLIVAFMLSRTENDRLICYSFLLFVVSFLNLLIYVLYCKLKLKSLRFSFRTVKKDISISMFTFAGWQLFGGVASVLRIQGANILFNLFGGSIVNAAQGIANQVNSAVSVFVNNFTTAINPPIIKSYASGNISYMKGLILSGAKYSFFLCLFFIIPLFLETNYVMHLWLGEYPQHTVIFIRIILVYMLVESLSKSLITGLNATGDIRKYQIIVSVIVLFNMPLSFILLKLGYPIESVLWISLILECCALFARMILSKRIYGLSIICYMKEVLINVVTVSIVSLIVPLLICTHMEYGLFRFIMVIFSSVISVSVSVFLIGINDSQRKRLLLKTKQYVNIQKNKSVS